MATGDELAHLPRVQHVIKSLAKYVNGKKLYAANNPRLAQFQDEFRSALEEFFRVEGELVLTIDQYAILWHGEKVYESDKRDESLAFLLYKDGVGEVTLRETALETEVDRFVQIVAEEYLSSHRGEEDVVTKLWNADFDHISYRVMDDYLASNLESDDEDGESQSELPDQAELLPSLSDKGRVIVKPSDPMETIDAYLKQLIMANCKASSDVEREDYFQSMVASFFALDDDEVARYHQEREREVRADSLVSFAETIFVFTLLQDNPSAVRDVSGILERMVDYIVTDRDAHALGRSLRLIRDFRASQSDLGDGVEALCAKLERKMTDPSLVRSFEEQLDLWAPGTEDVLAYFAAVGPPVIEPLLKILHRVEGGRLHREICNVLIQTAGDEIERVLDKMDIDNPKVAADAVLIAGKIGVKRLTPRIQELLYYPDRKVKEDMIALVGAMDDPGVPELLMGAISDSDKAIRCKAMQVGAARGFPQVVRHLNALAFGKDLYDKAPDEQETIFKALGVVGDAVTVEHLRKFVEKHHFMKLARKRDNKALAIRALEYIQEPSAVDLLQKLSRDSNETVRTRAVRALGALRSRMSTPGDGAGGAGEEAK